MSHRDRLAIMMHFNGNDGSKVSAELAGHPVSWSRDARLTTAVKKFGTAALRLPGGSESYLDIMPVLPAWPSRPSNEQRDFWHGPGTPPFAIEFWIRFDSVAQSQIVFAHRGTPGGTIASNQGYYFRWNQASARLEYWASTGNNAVAAQVFYNSFTPTVDFWHHIRVYRSAINLRLTIQVDGVDGGFSTNEFQVPFSMDPQPSFRIGADFDGSEPFAGYIDDFRFLFGDVIQGATAVPTGELEPLDAIAANTRIFASPLIAATDQPTSQTELWEPALWMLKNWTQAYGFNEAYNTRISQPTSQAEKRTQLLDRPYRSFRVRFTSLDRERTQAMGNQMNRWATARTLLPIFSDKTKLTAQATSGQPTISCNTIDRRFYIGQRVLLVRDLQVCQATTTEIKTIESFTDNDITFDSNLADTWPVNSLAYPLVECKQVLEAQRTRVTGHIGELAINFTETEGRTALPSIQDLDSVPAGIDTYGIPTETVYPIFKWTFQGGAQEIVSRAGQESNVGRATYVDSYGPRPKFGLRGNLCFLTRSEGFEFIRFFNSRGGRTCPFWVPSSFTEYQLQAVNPTSVSTSIVGDVGDWQFRPFIAFVLFDGTIVIRKIDNVVRSATTDLLQFSDPVTFAIGNVRRAARAALARFNTDEIRQSWETDETLRVNQVGYIETLEEKFISARVELKTTQLADVMKARNDIDCGSCENTEDDCDLAFDATPGSDGMGGAP